MNPLISIIIPSYNHEQYIEKAILSVLNQTYKSIELLVIDDCSNDNSVKIIENLHKQYNFSFIKHSKNKGLIATLNEALSIVNGKYFCMLGSDDIFYDTKIEKQVQCINENKECAICYANVTYIDENENIIKNGKIKHFKSGYVFNDLIFRDFMPLPTIMFKTDVVKEYNGFDERFFLEDYPLLLKITQKYQVCFLKEALTYYRLHRYNVSSDMVKMIKEVEKILADYTGKKIYKKAISKWYLRWFYDLAKTDYYDIIEEYFHKAKSKNWYNPKFIKAYLRFLKQKYKKQ